MANNFKRRSWIFISLHVAGLAMIIWPTAVIAAQLKDIRVGEYDGFTRVVFELDRAIASPHIEIQASGQLLVAFDNTDANLVRKIPVERSRHVEDVLLWQQQERLAAVLVFDYQRIRFETFPLGSPPRIAVDIFPLTDYDAADLSEPATSGGTKADIQARKEVAPQTLPQDSIENDRASAESSLSPAAIENDEANIKAAENALAPTPKPRPSESGDGRYENSGAKGAPRTNRLQFYLVIILVIITIAILVMLLLMLLVRSRLADEKAPMRTSEFLQHQDKKIAALNSRIKEQFKRYEDA